MIDLDMTMRDYLRVRLSMHTGDTYKGVQMLKFPEDLRTYERYMWEMEADAVIELGTFAGGATLWFRDRLPGRPIITVDLGPSPGLPDDVLFVQGDVLDPDLPGRIRALLPPGARPFIIEDTGHTYETTSAALTNFSPLAPDGGYLIVEDGVVDIEDLRMADDWPRGVQRAINDWLPLNPRFSQMDPPYLVTCHPGGFLRANRP